MRVRAHFKNIDKVIATIKAATIKNKDRKKDFHDAGLPSPPDAVITRWATWLGAALYYRRPGQITARGPSPARRSFYSGPPALTQT